MATSTSPARLLRLLTVDPSGKLTADLQSALGDMRTRLVRVDSYIEAFMLLHQAQFDVVILAHAVEDGSWRDLIDEIRAMQLTLPVIVTSPEIDECMWVDALFAGANHLLRTPFDSAEVQRTLQDVVCRKPKTEHTRRRTSHVKRYCISAARN